MASTYHRRVYAYHKRTVNGMDNSRAGRYSGDGVKQCWNLVQRGKFEARDGQAQLATMPGALTWGRGMAHHTAVGSGNGVYVEAHDVAMQSIDKIMPWTPATLGSTVFWLDAHDEDTAYLDTSDNAWKWTEKITGNTFSKAAGGGVSIQQSALLGRVFRFNNDKFSHAIDTTWTTQPYTFCIVFERGPLGTARFMFEFRSGTLSLLYMRANTTASLFVYLYTAFTTIANVDAGVGHYALMYAKGATSEFNMNGTTTSVALGTSPLLSSAVEIGGSRTEEYVGDIAEVIAFSGEMSAQDRLSLELYLKRKYGL